MEKLMIILNFFEPGYNNTNHTSFGLDKDDMRMIKRLFRYCSLCPQRFRPYSVWTKGSGKQTTSATGESIGDLGTDRYDRHHVLMDVISCYFFLLLVWIPLVILFVIPAVFSKIISNITQQNSKSNIILTLILHKNHRQHHLIVSIHFKLQRNV
eukprot:265206_1